MSLTIEQAEHYARVQFPALVKEAYLKEKGTRDLEGLTVAELAAEIGLAESSLFNKFGRRNRFNAAEVLYLSRRFNIKLPY